MKAWRQGKGQLLAEFKAASYAQSQGTACSPWAQAVAVEMEWSGLDVRDINETELTKLRRSIGHKRWGRRMREGWCWGFGLVQNANPEPSLVKTDAQEQGSMGKDEGLSRDHPGLWDLKETRTNVMGETHKQHSHTEHTFTHRKTWDVGSCPHSIIKSLFFSSPQPKYFSTSPTTTWRAENPDSVCQECRFTPVLFT